MDSRLEEDVENKKDKIVESLSTWGKSNIRDFPWRKERTPYKTLIAEVILRRTTAKAACRVYETLVKRYPNVYTLSHAKVEDLEEILSAVGYHKQRSRILKGMADFIVSEYKGEIPSEKGYLTKIPHVGQYIAGAILSLGYGIPSTMVDSNVQRIISRIFFNVLPDKRRYQTILEIVEAIAPQSNHDFFNFTMIDFGALVCRYEKPRCKECPLYMICEYPSKYLI